MMASRLWSHCLGERASMNLLLLLHHLCSGNMVEKTNNDFSIYTKIVSASQTPPRGSRAPPRQGSEEHSLRIISLQSLPWFYFCIPNMLLLSKCSLSNILFSTWFRDKVGIISHLTNTRAIVNILRTVTWPDTFRMALVYPVDYITVKYRLRNVFIPI